MADKDKGKETEARSLEELRAENQELYQALTNKNEQYMFQLNSALSDAEMDPLEKELIFNEMLHDLMQAQKKSIPARKLFGTVTERKRLILEGDYVLPEEYVEKSPTWQLYLDGALLLGGLFAIVNGIGVMQNPENRVGLLQIILNFILGGFASLILLRYAPKQGQTKGLAKYILATVALVFSWIFLMSIILWLFAMGYLPAALNPAVPGQVLLFIGALALLLKWYLKKKWNIQGTLI